VDELIPAAEPIPAQQDNDSDFEILEESIPIPAAEPIPIPAAEPIPIPAAEPIRIPVVEDDSDSEVDILAVTSTAPTKASLEQNIFKMARYVGLSG
jgi:hypothetical protein